jgi:hypothetical protein
MQLKPLHIAANDGLRIEIAMTKLPDKPPRIMRRILCPGGPAAA